MRIGLQKSNYFCVKEFFIEILITKMGVKMNLRIKTESYAACPKNFWQFKFYSRLNSRFNSDYVWVRKIFCKPFEKDPKPASTAAKIKTQMILNIFGKAAIFFVNFNTSPRILYFKTALKVEKWMKQAVHLVDIEIRPQ